MIRESGLPRIDLSRTSPRDFVFLRHGEAIGAADRCIGQTDLPLSSGGASAIRALASSWYDAGVSSILCPPTRIVTSDLRRAADSAALLAASWHLPVQQDPRLREMSFGRWDGQLWTTIETEDRARFQTWMAHWTETQVPDGESCQTVMQRAAHWLDTVLTSPYSGYETIAVVSHAGWIRAALVYLRKLPLSQMFTIPVDHAHAWIVRAAPSGVTVLAENVSCIPGSPGGPVATD